MQHEAAVNSALTIENNCNVYGEDLDRVDVSKYLHQLLSYDDNNPQAMWSNM